MRREVESLPLLIGLWAVVGASSSGTTTDRREDLELRRWPESSAGLEPEDDSRPDSRDEESRGSGEELLEEDLARSPRSVAGLDSERVDAALVSVREEDFASALAAEREAREGRAFFSACGFWLFEDPPEPLREERFGAIRVVSQ